ncbi:MAG: SUMF1/EgtB/PvdO family nonheme iron enzyme [Deltaproteobacteria bacterium]|nr:SUMF1/EgtB/PvdO family nonheme iron enzyme [Deltaproteobacteria bacterium]
MKNNTTPVLAAFVVGGIVALVAMGATQIDAPQLLGESLGSVHGALRRRAPRHVWRSVRDKHWQIVSSEIEETAVTDAREGNRGACSAGMIEVKGSMLVEPTDHMFSDQRIDRLQQETCVEWIQREYPERCARFDREAWLAASANLERKPMRFCIDRFEYPNLAGQYPMIFVSFHEAAELCEEQGKRLCNEEEWTFSCEGEEGRPYPYGDGYSRNPELCITDEPWTAYNGKAMVPRDGEGAGREMDRLWRGKASGKQPGCRSPFGVYDLTGNVDEWTRSTRQGERPSILKGGYWGPVRTRCRPSTRSHDQNHTFYQQGFRCCSDAASPAGAAPGRPTALEGAPTLRHESR